MIFYLFMLIPAAFFDIKRGIIPNRILMPAIITEGIIDQNLTMFLICLGLYLVLGCTQKYWKKYIGGADIKVLISILYLLQLQTILVINFAALYAVIYSYLTRKKKNTIYTIHCIWVS